MEWGEEMISIIIPYIRKAGLEKCIESINLLEDEIEYEIVVAEDVNRIGCPQMVKYIVSKTKYDNVMFLADDTEVHQGIMSNSLEKMKLFKDGIGLVGLNDQFISSDAHATHWLANKGLLPFLGGEFFHTGYRHCFSDNELTERCKEIGRYTFAKDAILTHNHPIVQQKQELVDDDYSRVYSQSYMKHDEMLFLKRKANGWKS
ncbi:MAG: glycosyltransferase family 2 protein [Candidatus Doudnabacteria bacterium]